jgi:uncharacterized membrane protein (UPF0127 family)/Skp family chaperone for outer membrane proteins
MRDLPTNFIVTRASGPCLDFWEMKQSVFRTSQARAGGPCHNEVCEKVTVRVSGIALFAVGLILTLTTVLRAQSGEPSHVGFIDLRLVYDNMQATIDSKKELASQQEQLDKLISFHHVDPKEKNPPIDLHEQTLRVKMVRAQARQLTEAYDQIRSVVADLAKTKGLDLVLIGTGTELPDNAADIANPQTTAGLVFNRTILYAADSLDLSAEAISLLNRDYKGSTTAPLPLPTTPMQIGSKTFQLEIAGDQDSWEHGLMERNAMAADHGMIFVFPDVQSRSFWMHHTRFPLDVLFVDDHGKVVSCHTMKAYDEHATFSDFPAKYVVELSAGEIDASRVKPGDQLKIPPVVDAALKK